MELNGENFSEKTLSGFRLHKFELRNWGTFDKWIWNIAPSGHNALLTGDIGSGKSTLVDAITTLLVRQDRIIYNKAAGAESRERTIYSYIRGAYKNEKAGASGKSQDVYLRDENTYSVILGQFRNAHFNEQVTLAQVFWLRNSKPDKFFVIAHGDIGIKEEFSDFGPDISRLKKRLKHTPDIEVFDSFTDYANRFRQLFGIKQAGALDLFYQTVSMKSVGNLTDFVRDQMLGKTNIQDEINDLVRSYEELTKAHDAAQRARHQREMLEPLMQNISQFTVIKEEIAQYVSALSEIPKWFSLRRIWGLRRRLQEQVDDYERNENDLAALDAELTKDRNTLRQLENQRDRMEVSRILDQIIINLEHLERGRIRKEKDAKRYESLCKALDLPEIIDEDRFYKNLKEARESLTSTQEALTATSGEQRQLHIELDRLAAQEQELKREIDSLQTRQTQIPERNIALREQIRNALGLNESDIPYAGELIRVKDDERAWEGAIERRLHDFGLSMLVPDRHYKAISRYVNEHHLHGRLVYLRVFDRNRRDDVEVKSNSLFHKVQIKSDSEFSGWLEAEVSERYNYVCCSTLEEFHREPYGLTKEGQIKSGKVKHEKNDLRNVNDRKHYILGWSNAEKIKEYRKDLEKKSAQIRASEYTLESLGRQEDALSLKNDQLRDLMQFDDFTEIDFKKTVAEIQSLRERKKALEASSDELKTVQQEIEKLQETIARKDDRKGKRREEKGRLEDRISQNAVLLKRNVEDVTGQSDEWMNLSENIFTDLRAVVNRWTAVELPPIQFSPITLSLVAGIKETSSPDALNADEKRILEKVNNPGGLLDKKKNAQKNLEKDIVLIMERYREQYQAETNDVDATIESIPDFEAIYEKLVVDDIPRHEGRFKTLLKEGAINGILVFQNQLDGFDKEIARKIADINKHLVDIPYNAGTYITITQDAVPEKDIAEFKNDLKACLANIYGEADSYNEEKFHQVKKILDRFKGETDEDKRWTERVTDVRQWYTFGASERYEEDDKEKEYYSDSSGKSGGQKEKLAYTILASAIAFQFGLSWDESRSRSFRFVVIDEAFGRGSDESTRYGLRLFRKLNLQLLIVTPLQKINIIEDYINSVHFVSNPSGQASMVRNITKEEYVKKKQQYFADLEHAK